MGVEERMDEFVGELMERRGAIHFSGREEVIQEVYDEYCRHCSLKNDCDICYTAKTELEEEISRYNI